MGQVVTDGKTAPEPGSSPQQKVLMMNAAETSTLDPGPRQIAVSEAGAEDAGARSMPVLQAADDAGGAGGHVGAELLAVLEAGLCERHIKADVAGGVLHDLDHPRRARR